MFRIYSALAITFFFLLNGLGAAEEYRLELISSPMLVIRETNFIDSSNRPGISYRFPSVNSRIDPRYFSTVKIDETPDKKSKVVLVYSMPVSVSEDFSKPAEPLFSHPAVDVNTGPFWREAQEAPRLVKPSQGTEESFLLLQQKKLYNEKPDWEIYRISPRNIARGALDQESLLYRSKDFPECFAKRGDVFYHTAPRGGLMAEGPSSRRKKMFGERIISFDVHEDMYALCHYAAKENPDIVLKRGERGRIEYAASNPRVAELYPKFSENGEYFAYARNRVDNHEIWDLVIVETRSPMREIKVIEDVYLYDYHATFFSFDESYHWLRNVLFYRNEQNPGQDGSRPRVIQAKAFSPSSNRFDRYSVRPSYSGEFSHPKAGEPGYDVMCSMTVEPRTFGLFQAVEKAGDTYLIAECSIDVFGYNDRQRLPPGSSNRKESYQMIGVFKAQRN